MTIFSETYKYYKNQDYILGYVMAIFTVSRIFIIYMGLIRPMALSQKRSIETNKLMSNKLNECAYCKVLTDSFNIWLDKTSRGKHEGGDVAWEEARLKSYARSEMRLVEIQESLCSEVKIHQDQCYSLAEEADQVIEKWWFHENYDNFDLYTWVCIENLQYCCPSNHFGEMCIPCPQDINNKICGGNGKCDGDGTRKGNGSCICTRGYSGSNCDECATNFYRTVNACKPCHQSCNGCHRDGSNACIKCASGWSMEMGVCVDINECLISCTCEDSNFCINRDGSYVCKSCDRTCKTCIGPGPRDCTSCTAKSMLWMGKCMSNVILKDHLKDAFKRTGIYLSLFILAIIISRKSTALASFVIFFIPLLLYFIEKNSEIRLIDVYSIYTQDLF